VHDCNVPNTSAKIWRCHCGREWKFVEMKEGGWQEAFAELWHGKRNMRRADGGRL
jgi:hypothetical protein